MEVGKEVEILDKEEIKIYLKIDSDTEDKLLETFRCVAETYLEDAGIRKTYEKATYKLAVLMLVSHFYTNRSVVSESSRFTLQEMPFGIRSLIQQLQFTKEVLTPYENK